MFLHQYKHIIKSEYNCFSPLLRMISPRTPLTLPSSPLHLSQSSSTAATAGSPRHFSQETVIPQPSYVPSPNWQPRSLPSSRRPHHPPALSRHPLPLLSPVRSFTSYSHPSPRAPAVQPLLLMLSSPANSQHLGTRGPLPPGSEKAAPTPRRAPHLFSTAASQHDASRTTPIWRALTISHMRRS